MPTKRAVIKKFILNAVPILRKKRKRTVEAQVKGTKFRLEIQGRLQ